MNARLPRPVIIFSANRSGLNAPSGAKSVCAKTGTIDENSVTAGKIVPAITAQARINISFMLCPTLRIKNSPPSRRQLPQFPARNRTWSPFVARDSERLHPARTGPQKLPAESASKPSRRGRIIYTDGGQRGA